MSVDAQSYALLHICIIRSRFVFQGKMVLVRLVIKEHIKSGLFSAFPAHPLEAGSVSAQDLFYLERTLWT